MKKNTIKPIKELLDTFSDEHHSLRAIQEQTRVLSTLGTELASILPPQMRSHIKAANFREGVLVLHVSSAAWKMQLNYLREELISTLRQTALPNLASIDIKINPDLLTQHFLKQETLPVISIAAMPKALQLEHPRRLSSETSAILLKLAEVQANNPDKTVDADKFAEALKRLALHGIK